MKIKTLMMTAAALALFVPADKVSAQAKAGDQKAKKATKTAQFPNMTVAEVQQALKDGKITVIDVNPLKSYKAGHVPGALHFGTVKKELAKSLPEDKNALILAYCGGPT